jgi:hypothetical protein
VAAVASDGLTADGKRIFGQIEELGKLAVYIGFQEGVQYPDGTEVVDVAAWNELGTEYIPERPFLRMSVDDNEDKIATFMKKAAMEVINNGKTAQEVLKEVGAFQKGIVQQEIREGSFEPNSPATIKKKGSSKPLIDTGLMRQSVNFVIKEKGK